METLLDELKQQEDKYFDSLLKTSGVDAATAERSSRSTLRSELERARAEQLQLQEKAREQEAQIEAYRSHAQTEVQSLEQRLRDFEAVRRDESVKHTEQLELLQAQVTTSAPSEENKSSSLAELADEPPPRRHGSARRSRGGGSSSARLDADPPSARLARSPPAPASTRDSERAEAAPVERQLADNRERMDRLEHELLDVRDNVDALREQVAALLRAGVDGREPRPRLSAAAAASSAASPAASPRSRSPAAAQEAPPHDASQALRRLQEVSSKYETLKRKFARQTVREAELHGYLLHNPAAGVTAPKPARTSSVTARAPSGGRRYGDKGQRHAPSRRAQPATATGMSRQSPRTTSAPSTAAKVPSQRPASAPRRLSAASAASTRASALPMPAPAASSGAATPRTLSVRMPAPRLSPTGGKENAPHGDHTGRPAPKAPASDAHGSSALAGRRAPLAPTSRQPTIDGRRR